MKGTTSVVPLSTRITGLQPLLNMTEATQFARETTAIVTAAEAMRRLAAADDNVAELFRHGTLQVKLYAPRGLDDQTPHLRDEAYVVLGGKGEFVSEGSRQAFGPGDFIFAPAGVAHHFEDFSDDFAVWVFFYGPEGGEGK